MSLTFLVLLLYSGVIYIHSIESITRQSERNNCFGNRVDFHKLDDEILWIEPLSTLDLQTKVARNQDRIIRVAFNPPPQTPTPQEQKLDNKIKEGSTKVDETVKLGVTQLEKKIQEGLRKVDEEFNRRKKKRKFFNFLMKIKKKRRNITNSNQTPPTSPPPPPPQLVLHVHTPPEQPKPKPENTSSPPEIILRIPQDEPPPSPKTVTILADVHAVGSNEDKNKLKPPKTSPKPPTPPKDPVRTVHFVNDDDKPTLGVKRTRTPPPKFNNNPVRVVRFADDDSLGPAKRQRAFDRSPLQRRTIPISVF